MITSPQNDRVKDWVRLRKDGNVRRKRGLFLVEGKSAVRAALDANAKAKIKIAEVIHCPNLLGDDGQALVAQAESTRVEVVTVSKDCFRKIADTKSPQGVAAVIHIPEAQPELLQAPDALIVLCCGIADPGNLGTIIRTADAVGATAVVSLPPAADFYNAKVIRSTAASLLNVPVFPMLPDACLTTVNDTQLKIIAAEASGDVSYTDADWSRPVCIAVGNEAHGVPHDVLAAATQRVSIPIRGGAESLNAAVAASILLYEAVRGA